MPRLVVQVRGRPLRVTPERPARPGRSAPARTASVLRATGRFALFYATTALLIVAGIGLHEYSHYAAHEGFGVPDVAYSDGVTQAQAGLLQVERSRGASGQEVLVQQPQATTIVFYPNTFLQAAGLGLLPTGAYKDNGVLASTFFHLNRAEVDGVQARGGEMSAPVILAPLWVAIVVFVAALAWTLWRPNLFNKALLVASAVQLGDAGHHATALGMSPTFFFVASTLAIVVAAVLVGLRSLRPTPAQSAKPDLRRPAKASLPVPVRRASPKASTRLVVAAPPPRALQRAVVRPRVNGQQ